MKYQKLLPTVNERGIVQYYNPDYVMYIQATALPDGSTKCGITVQGGMSITFWDVRTAEQVRNEIEANEKLRTK